MPGKHRSGSIPLNDRLDLKTAARKRAAYLERCWMKTPQIVYIAGYGRSGSTVLDMLLSSVPDTLGLGELSHFLPAVGLDERLPDGRQSAWRQFWGNVRAGFVARMGGRAACRQCGAVQLTFERFGGLFHTLWRAPGAQAAQYRQCQRRLIEAIAEAKSCRFIVDSSKTAWQAAWRPLALQRIAGLEVKVIHLVRDGRGVIWSQMRGSNRQLEAGSAGAAQSLATLRSVVGWTWANGVVPIQKLWLPPRSVIRVRYEDLVNQPQRELSRISAFLGIDLSTVAHQLSRGRPFPGVLQYTGNRVRHSGIDRLREDDAWKRCLPRNRRLFYWLSCFAMHYLFCKRPSYP
jgi:hypothetical protein